MRFPFVSCFAFVILACCKQGSEVHHDPATPLHVVWDITREASDVIVSYRVENRSDQQLLVLDDVVEKYGPGYAVFPERAIIHYSPTEKRVVFLAGQLPSVNAVPAGSFIAVDFETMPAARPIGPGQSLTGKKRVPLPLAPWHPDLEPAVMEPIPSGVTEAILEIDWLPRSPPDGVFPWRKVPAESGGTLEMVSEPFVRQSKQTARGPALRIP